MVTDIYSGRPVPSSAAHPLTQESDLRTITAQCRTWSNIPFIATVNETKLAFYNYGLTFREKRDDGSQVEVDDDWMEEHEEELLSYVEDTWRQWLIQCSAVSFWRGMNPDKILSISTENLEYKDNLGIETLKVWHNLSPSEVQKLPPPLKKRYESPCITLPDPTFEVEHPDLAEYFEVVRRGVRGRGLPVPRLFGLAQTCTQHEAMEAGENLLSHAGRTLIRWHKMGHEIKAGIKAGTNAYHYKKAKGDELSAALKGKIGFFDFATNFDHNVGYVWIDPKLYDAKKWETTTQRILLWAGSAGFMLLARGLQPFLMQLFKVEAAEERRKIARHIASVTGRAFGRRIVPCWSDRCFQETRLAQEMMKFLVQQGVLDTGTATVEAGYDREEVLRGKAKDIELLDKDERFLAPAWNRGGQGDGSNPNKNKHGRPPGKPDPAGT